MEHAYCRLSFTIGLASIKVQDPRKSYMHTYYVCVCFIDFTSL